MLKHIVYSLLTPVMLTLPALCLGQSPAKLAKEPIVIMRSNKLSGKSIVNYMTDLNKELQIGQNMIRMMEQQDIEQAVTQHPSPVTGQMVFMVQGFVPGAESITFSQVAGEADFNRIVQAGKRAAGGASVTLEGSDGKFKQSISTSWREDITDRPQPVQGETTGAKPNQVTISIGASSSSGGSVNVSSGNIEGTIIEENGRRYREHSVNITQYIRYHDGFMFNSTYEDLFNMDLPSGDSLIGAAKNGMDAELDFYPDRIPLGFKQLFWNTISSTAGTELQQRDEEDPVDYAMRRSAGDVGLEALRAVLFDVDQLSGRLTLADVDRPLTGELKFRARQNSNFSKRLDGFTSGRSRFAPILSDDSALTFHTSIHLPEETAPVITSTAAWLKNRIINASEGDVDVAIAGSEFGESMEELAGRRDLEVFIKVGWTPSAGAVIYGGIQVDDNPEMLKSLFDLLTGQHLPEDFTDRLTMTKRGDHQMIQMQLPDAGPDSPVHLTHLFITHVNSCLWIAAGGDTADDILRQSIERCGVSGLRSKTPLVTGRLDMARWLAWPQDEPTGLAALPYWLDRVIFAGASSITTVGSAGDVDSSDAETPVKAGSRPAPVKPRASSDLMATVISMGGTQDANFFVDADESGIQIQGNVGAAVARYLVVRWLMVMDNLMPGISDDAVDQDAGVPLEVSE